MRCQRTSPCVSHGQPTVPAAEAAIPKSWISSSGGINMQASLSEKALERRSALDARQGPHPGHQADASTSSEPATSRSAAGKQPVTSLPRRIRC